MSFTLVLNSQNVIGTGNNTYKYDFIKGNFTIPEDSEVMVANVQLPYSFYNITSAYNNNQFKLYFPTASSTYTIFTITIPDGFYTTTSLNFFLQQYCITNGLYLVNGSGQNVYYFSIQYNSYQYGNQVITTLVPTTLPSGFTTPSNWIGFPSFSRAPSLEILNNNFGAFLGFTTGLYPTFGSNAVITPALNPISITSFTINNAGTGYSGTLPVILTGGGGTYSGFTANIVNGAVTTINMGTSSGYSTAPTVTISGGGGSGVNITCTINAGSINAFTYTAAGSGFTSTKPVTISGSGWTISNYVATVSTTGTITAISGGTSTGSVGVVPTVVITTPGSGTGFNATVNVPTTTTLAPLTITDSGSNYNSSLPPIITITGGGGSGASASAVVSNGSIVSISNFVAGSGFTSLPTVSISVGYNANYSVNSPITPIGSYVNSVIIRCSLVNNRVGNPMDIIDSFTIGQTNFGANINYAPSVNKWVKLSSGTFSNFLISFCDQNLNLIQALDNNILITLLFKFPSVKLLKNE